MPIRRVFLFIFFALSTTVLSYCSFFFPFLDFILITSDFLLSFFSVIEHNTKEIFFLSSKDINSVYEMKFLMYHQGEINCCEDIFSIRLPSSRCYFRQHARYSMISKLIRILRNVLCLGFRLTSRRLFDLTNYS